MPDTKTTEAQHTARMRVNLAWNLAELAERTGVSVNELAVLAANDAADILADRA